MFDPFLVPEGIFGCRFFPPLSATSAFIHSLSSADVLPRGRGLLADSIISLSSAPEGDSPYFFSLEDKPPPPRTSRPPLCISIFSFPALPNLVRPSATLIAPHQIRFASPFVDGSISPPPCFSEPTSEAPFIQDFFFLSVSVGRSRLANVSIRALARIRLFLQMLTFLFRRVIFQ